MVERTTSSTALTEHIIDIIDLDNYSYRAPERLQGSFLTIEELSDSSDEAEMLVYEIESDKDEAVEVDASKRRRRRRRPVVDTESEESDYSSPKRRMITDNTQKRHYLRNKSVKVVPSEVWLKIFSFSDPAFLARARRISKNFRTLIDDEKVWRYARLYHFPEYPSPAFDLKESEMWNLYLGTGCMICSAPKIKNRYWRFRIRCCLDCLGKATIKEDLLKHRHGFKPRWMKYLFPSVLRYGKWRNWTVGCGLRTYCLEDVKILERGMKFSGSPESVLISQMEKVRRDVGIMEIFEEKLSGQRYFEIRKRISRLNPPFTDDILSHIPAYGSAIKIQRPLTDRSWNILLKKLEVGREAAVKNIEQARQQERLKALARPFWEMRAGAATLSNLKKLPTPSSKDIEERMIKVFSKIQPFLTLPDSHRLFLWFRLCITMHARDYNQLPDIRTFAVAADTIHESNGRRAFEGLLVCGICRAHQSKKKKGPWAWSTLHQHFDSHNSFKKTWPEKMLVLPSAADISESCSRIDDKTVRRLWIELLKEADEELGGMLDDKLRSEEDAARSKAIQDERAADRGEKDRTNHQQSQKRRREADLLRNPGRGVDNGGDNREKRLKVGGDGYKNVPVPSFSNIPSWGTSRDPTSTIPQARARETWTRETTVKSVEVLRRKSVGMPPVVPRVIPPIERAIGAAAKPAAVLPMKPFTAPLERARETRAPRVAVKPVKILPGKPIEIPPAVLPRGQETRVPRAVLPTKPPMTSPTRARETWPTGITAKSAKIPPRKPVEMPPAVLPRGQETRAVRTAAKPAGALPVKPPLARARETRVLETTAKSVGVLPANPVEMPPAILPSVREPPARANPKLPEIHRDRSPSVDMDIEALFADA